MDKDLATKTISGLKWTTLSTIVIVVIGIIKISILTRYLELSDFGLMALVSFVMGFMDLFMDVGLTSAILHKQEITKGEYDSLYWLNVMFSLALCAVVFVFSPILGSYYQEPELPALIKVMSVSIIISALGKQFRTIEQKELNFKYIASIDASAAIFGLVVGVWTVFLELGVYTLVYSALSQYAFSNGVYFLNGLKSRGLNFRFKFPEVKPFLKIGIYHAGGQIVNYFNRDIDVLLIGKFFGSEILGGYSMAKQLTMRPMQIISPLISKVASPVLSILGNDSARLKKTYLSFLRSVSTINFLAYLLLGIFAYPIVWVLYGKEFLHIVCLVQILSAFMYLRSVGSSVGSLLIATGKTRLGFYWNLFILLVSPITIWIGAQFSIEFVALALLITTIIVLIPFWKLLIYRLCGATSREYFLSYVPSFKRVINLLRRYY